MRKVLFILTISTLFLSGCHVSSRTAMYGSGGRTSYNVAAQNTTNQELLLNLVRLRYSDTPYFLELNGITTQFNFSSKLNSTIKLPGFDNDNPASVGGELGWSNQPTIQYSPLEGKDFAIQMMQPLDLRIIQGLVFTGWDVDRVFRLLIQNMADIPNASAASGPVPTKAPHYRKFFECLELLRHFQSLGVLQIGVRYIPPEGSKGVSEEEACERRPNAIQISFPANGSESDRLADLLEGIKKSKGRYVLNMRQAFNEEASLGLMTRSLLGTMYYLSLGVKVPPKDIAAGTVAMTLNDDGTLFDWHHVIGDLMCINWSYRQPDNYYLAVPYRGYWFFIDDSDISSKRTFVLLQQIYNLQAKQQEKEGPLLTIPLGAP
ncbi:MAG: hypothetical protein H7A41_05355 [Chlamydiales bacterium]|nr:hypothetical protein [Chlamydiia bacterium]MCP5504564.1 hypothetical protein [Chlamydiales bacterium]